MAGGMHGRGGVHDGGHVWQGGVHGREGAWPCDLSHHAFDVTCMLSPHQLRPTNSAAPYIVLVGHVTHKPPPPPVNRITDRCKNITFAQTTFAGGNNNLRPCRCYVQKFTHVQLPNHMSPFENPR